MSSTPPRPPTDPSTSAGEWFRTPFPITLLIVAAVSVVHAVITAPRLAIDILLFREMGDVWLHAKLPFRFYAPPPFAAVLFAPFALVARGTLIWTWLAVNLVSAAAIIRLAPRLWGEDWSLKTRILFGAFFLSWAPFRVTLRTGQISLITVALLLGVFLLRRKNRDLLAGLLLGLSLWKYPLSLPFFLYFAWQKKWKMTIVAALLPGLLTVIYAWRLPGLSLRDVVIGYVRGVAGEAMSNGSYLTGTTELKPLIVLTGIGEPLPGLIAAVIAVLALATMVLVFSRCRTDERLHYSAIALFSLWSVYHRSYDAVICIIPAAFLLRHLLRGEFARTGLAGLIGLGLFIVGIPGLLTDRLGLDPAGLGIVGKLGIHSERLLVFSLFWICLWLIWKSKSEIRGNSPRTNLEMSAEGATI